jgi:hypothetical protein
MSGTRLEDVEVQVLVDATWLDGWLDTWQKRDGRRVGFVGYRTGRPRTTSTGSPRSRPPDVKPPRDGGAPGRLRGWWAGIRRYLTACARLALLRRGGHLSGLGELEIRARGRVLEGSLGGVLVAVGTVPPRGYAIQSSELCGRFRVAVHHADPLAVDVDPLTSLGRGRARLWSRVLGGTLSRQRLPTWSAVALSVSKNVGPSARAGGLQGNASR